MIDTRPTGNHAPHHLFGLNGELVRLRIPVEPRMLEELLEALASLDFPINPELRHHPGVVQIEFPAYASHIEDVRALLTGSGFDAGSLEVFAVLDCQAATA